MQEIVTTCPCCGRPFVVAVHTVVMQAECDSEEAVKLASELGIELGVCEGGEKIGD